MHCSASLRVNVNPAEFLNSNDTLLKLAQFKQIFSIGIDLLSLYFKSLSSYSQFRPIWYWSINITSPDQSEALIVDDRVFQNHGVRWQVFSLSRQVCPTKMRKIIIVINFFL